MQVRKVGIILKKGSEQPRKICKELQAFFAERQIAVLVDQVSDDCDMLIILGGDGTLLHVADQASRLADTGNRSQPRRTGISYRGLGRGIIRNPAIRFQRLCPD